MDVRLQLKLTQRLVMTPNLQQAIKLLQLSRLELEEYIQDEMLQNPMLEESVPEDHDADRVATSEDTSAIKEHNPDKPEPREANAESATGDEFDWERYFEQGQDYQGGMPQQESLGPVLYENFLKSTEDLEGHLVWQVQMSHLGDEDRNIAYLLIGNLEDDGYLREPLETIAAEEDVPLADLERVLCVIQQFDPVGVGSRNLQECLLVQYHYYGHDDPVALHIIENYLPLLERKQYQELARKLRVSAEVIRPALQLIESFEPKPGRKFASGPTHYVLPDVYVSKVDGEFVVSLNDDGLPRLRLSNVYKQYLDPSGSDEGSGGGGYSSDLGAPDIGSLDLDSALASDTSETTEHDLPSEPADSGSATSANGNGSPTSYKETRDFLEKKMRSALWLIKSVEQRKRTIYRVTEAIVRMQRDFFEKGVSHLKPMVLRDIAEEIGVHESTVSRVSTNKYLHCAQGVFELKYFFHSGIATDSGEDVSSLRIKEVIKEEIGKENEKKPLSDQKLAKIIEKRVGVNIARRTVAKYRIDLNIPASSQRKSL